MSRYYKYRHKKTRKISEWSLSNDIDKLNETIKFYTKLKEKYIDYDKRLDSYHKDEKRFIEPLKIKLKIITDYRKNLWNMILLIFNVNTDKFERKNLRELKGLIATKYHELNLKHDLKNNPYKISDYSHYNRDEEFKTAEYHIRISKEKIDYKLEQIERLKRKTQKIDEIQGLAAKAKGQSRQRANKLKKGIRNNEYCPYCGDLILESHVDHIYPIAKGGTSTINNMVRVCSSCNLRKKDMTLNQFIKKYKLDREQIESDLDLLDKIY